MTTVVTLPPNEVPWVTLDNFDDRVVHQRKSWLDFLSETQLAEPVVAEIRDDGELVGYFTGLVVRRFGLRILGSPFPGWTTTYMGFNLRQDYSRREALQALETWAFRDLGCVHFEVCDYSFRDHDSSTLEHTYYSTYVTDINRGLDEIFGGMRKSCRWSIRKAERNGVTIEEAVGDATFAADYFNQLKDVFAKQGKVPSYRLDRVESLIKHVHPTGNLLLLRARDQDGTCIGTGIYPGYGKIAQFWGNASWRQHQHLRPNEALNWYAMKYWSLRGAQKFDWGAGTYKEKYGVTALEIPWYRKSKYPFLRTARNGARSLFYFGQRALGGLRGYNSRSRQSP